MVPRRLLAGLAVAPLVVVIIGICGLLTLLMLDFCSAAVDELEELEELEDLTDSDTTGDDESSTGGSEGATEQPKKRRKKRPQGVAPEPEPEPEQPADPKDPQGSNSLSRGEIRPSLVRPELTKFDPSVFDKPTLTVSKAGALTLKRATVNKACTLDAACDARVKALRGAVGRELGGLRTCFADKSSDFTLDVKLYADGRLQIANFRHAAGVKLPRTCISKTLNSPADAALAGAKLLNAKLEFTGG